MDQFNPEQELSNLSQMNEETTQQLNYLSKKIQELNNKNPMFKSDEIDTNIEKITTSLKSISELINNAKQQLDNKSKE